MELQAELVHAEPGRRVVRVSAREGSQGLGSALGEGEDAESAEDRAIARLRARLSPSRKSSPSPATSTRAQEPAPEQSSLLDKPSVPSPPPPAAPAHSPAPAPPPAETAAAETAAPEADTQAIEPPMDPEDWSQELVQLDLQVQRLGWSREQEGIYLQRAFGHPSRSRLTRWADLTAFLRALEGLAPNDDPATAPVPLQRRDLLSQGDALLERLGWDAPTARRFLTQELGASSRQQLDDGQLLQFNMLLEEAWMAAADG